MKLSKPSAMCCGVLLVAVVGTLVCLFRAGVVKAEKASLREDQMAKESSRGGLTQSEVIVDSELEDRILKIGSSCTNIGFKTWRLALSIGNEIMSVNDSRQRKRLSCLYLDTLERIDPLSCGLSRRSRALNNFAQLLAPWECLAQDEESAEKVFGLLCVCLRHYHHAISDLQNGIEQEMRQGKGKRGDILSDMQQAKWNCVAGLQRFSMAITNDILPRASERNLLGERFLYWKTSLVNAINGTDSVYCRGGND